MKLALRAICGLFLFGGVFWIWYGIAANYDYGALSGTYVFEDRGETCTLRLRQDRTFVQEIDRSGKIERSRGQWHRYGEAHVSFSSEFQRVTGEEMNAAGEAHGEFEKKLGIFPVLTLAPLPSGPVFHKKLKD